MNVRAVALTALVLSSTLSLVACASTDTGPSASTTSESVSSESTVGFSQSDIMFAQMMIPHHEQAVEMSDLAASRTTNPEILALAEQIRAAQAPEIEQMRTWLTDSGASMDMGHSMHMDGMLDEEQMDALAAAEGTAFDRLYLEGMIEHHEGAIDMAQMVIGSKNTEAATLGNNIVSSQTAEIATMTSLLAAL